jgi:type II secretory pathway pseudopilin PulG
VDGRRTAIASEEGYSLAEMMVAIMVLGFVLSGLASVLITSISATVMNERETRATAYAQQAIEQLQSVDWDFAGLYTDDIAAAPTSWSDRLSDPGFYDGLQLVTIPGPTPAAARVDSVPPPTRTISDAGVDYQVHRFVTWVDRSGDGVADTRRFTVVAEWDDRGADRGITLTAERAPTQGDMEATAGGARILQMTIDPQTVGLDDDQFLVPDPDDESRHVIVRVVLNRTVTGVPKLYYYGLDSANEWVLFEAESRPLDSADQVAMAQNGESNTRFRFRLPDTARMVEGTQDLLFVGTVDGETISRYATLTLVGGKLEGGNPVPPAPTDATDPVLPDLTPTPGGGGGGTPTGEVRFTTVSSSNLCVHPGTWLPSSPFTITSTVTGLSEEDGDVMVSYQYRKRARTGNGHLATTSEASVIAPGGTTTSSVWTFTISEGMARHFQPNSTVTFTVRASREDGSTATRLQNVVVSTC